MTRPAGTGCVKNSGFKAVEKGSPTLHREFTHACDLPGKSCLLAPVLISIYIWERFMQFLSFTMFRQDPMLPLCLDAAVSRGRPYVLVNVHLLLNQNVGITSASLHSVYFVSQWPLPAAMDTLTVSLSHRGHFTM